MQAHGPEITKTGYFKALLIEYHTFSAAHVQNQNYAFTYKAKENKQQHQDNRRQVKKSCHLYSFLLYSTNPHINLQGCCHCLCTGDLSQKFIW